MGIETVESPGEPRGGRLDNSRQVAVLGVRRGSSYKIHYYNEIPNRILRGGHGNGRAAGAKSEEGQGPCHASEVAFATSEGAKRATIAKKAEKEREREAAGLHRLVAEVRLAAVPQDVLARDGAKFAGDFQ